MERLRNILRRSSSIDIPHIALIDPLQWSICTESGTRWELGLLVFHNTSCLLFTIVFLAPLLWLLVTHHSSVLYLASPLSWIKNLLLYNLWSVKYRFFSLTLLLLLLVEVPLHRVLHPFGLRKQPKASYSSNTFLPWLKPPVHRIYQSENMVIDSTKFHTRDASSKSEKHIPLL